MKHENSRFVVARLMLVVLTLAITVFTFASCEGLPPELEGLLGGNPNENCEHEYDNKCDFRCNKCDAALIGIPTHYYDNDCDTDCNECGATRAAKHTYDNACDTDCNVCDAERETEHTYDNACDTDCNGCDAERETEHTYDNACDTDCNVCDAERETEHTYDNACDTDCNTCGATRTTEHAYTNGVCGVCGAIDCKHTTVQNCVCQECNAPVHGETECLPAMAPDCDDFGIRYDIYMCYNCERIFSDAICKNEVTDLNSVVIPPLGHKFVGGVCEKCAVTNQYGGGDNGNHPGEPTPFELACRELASLYGPDNKKATSSDYELVSKIVIEGEEFAVTWTIANESITITYNEANGVYVVDIPDEITKNCYYSIEASITNNANGRTVKYLFTRLLEATTDGDDDGDSAVCQHKNAEYVKATPEASCSNVKTLVDVYVCCDCLKVFYDAECEDEVPTTTAVATLPSGHTEVGGVCEKCGYYRGEGGLPSRYENPAPLEAAWWYIIDLYYADQKKATTTDYELISKVVIGGEELAVSYTFANESITVTYDADKDVYVVDIPDEVEENCYYSITATVRDSEGRTREFMLVRLLVATKKQ